MPKGNRCPFELIPQSEDDIEQERKTTSFKQPIDPADPNGIKLTHHATICDSSNIEDILKHELQFTQLQQTMNLDTIIKRKAVYEATLSPSLQTAWRQACTLPPVNANFNAMNLIQFANAREQFVIRASDCTRTLAEDTRFWLLYDLKKPRSMNVHDFQKRINQICEYFLHMPRPRDTMPVTPRLPSPDESDKIAILHNSCPRSWRDEQARTNQLDLDLQQLLTYYATLKSIEKNDDEKRPQRNGKSRNGFRRRSNNKGRPKKKNDEHDPPCPIHNGTHRMSQCRVIRAEREKFQDKKERDQNEDTNKGNRNRNNSARRPYDKKKHYDKKKVRFNSEQNNELSPNNADVSYDSDDDESVEHMTTLQEEMNTINDSNEKDLMNQEQVNFSTETKVKAFGSNKAKMLNCLLDSGASGTHIKRRALRNVNYTSTRVNVNVNGRYATSKISEMVEFEGQLTDFCESRTVKIRAYVDENAVGDHDLILGSRFCNELGMILDYKNKKIIWDDLAIPMLNKSKPIALTAISDENEDQNLPSFMKKATHRLSKGLSANQYDKHNYKDMVEKCEHLTSDMKSALLDLFSKYEELFSGTLGKVPGPPVKLKLKEGALPFYSRAYTVPKAIEKIAKREVMDLVDADVLAKNVETAYTSPCFFKGKKDGGMRFLTDLRKLNASLERQPFPLPIIDDVIWKMSGYTFATCLDLNRGYYHIVLDEESSKLCGIILPWGIYCYKRLPQGLMVSSDIFQRKMSSIFQNFDDIIVYIDNIILYTKSTFSHHVRRLGAVLEQLKQNNLHVHVEQTFLASKRVDYLGYTLTPKGIEPQSNKILPILRFSPPTKLRQLRAFLGLVNYYKKLVPHRSHILEPLTRISSGKTKFKWTHEQEKAFLQIKRLMARKILLRYPNFEKDFHIFTDASDFQLGSVITQEDFPIAFYSRKLNSAQKNYTTMEKELLSIVETLEFFRGILLGFKVYIHSDHKNLSFNTFKSERVRRWRLLLEEYDYVFIYTPGKDNVIADMISRYPIDPAAPQELQEVCTSSQVLPLHDTDDDSCPIDFNIIAKHQKAAAHLQQLLTRPDYSIRNIHGPDLIFHKNKVLIPPSLLNRIITWYHELLNHPGVERTYKTISIHFYARGMEARVRIIVRRCSCQKNKRVTKNYGHLPPTFQDYQPWEVVQADLFGPWKYTDVDGIERAIQAVSFMDVATRWPELHEYDSKKSENISLIFDQEWLNRYPRPRMVIYDNGSEFSSEWREMLESFGIIGKPTTVKNPQANAFVERIHLVIADCIRSMDLPSRSYDDTTAHSVLQAVAWGIRSTFHTALQATPGQLAFGRDMIVNATYMANWHAIKERKQQNTLYNNARENKSRQTHDYQPGQFVYIKNKDIKRKLNPDKAGPFEIISVHTNGTITIRRSPTVIEKINIRRAHPVY